MPVRSRNSTPPFELMSTEAIASSGVKRRVYTDEIADDAPAGGARGGRWWGQLHQPLVIRVPPGVLVLGVVGLLAAVLLAYWAGQARGFRNGQLTMLTGSGQHRAATASKAVVVGTGAVEAIRQNSLSHGRSAGVESMARPVPLRRNGLNYFVLAHCPREEATQLVEFLHEHGLESAAFRAQNGRFFQVMALHGFEKDDILGPTRQQLEQRVRELGRLWSTKRYGPDFSQTGIYLDLYEGEPVAETILVQQEQT